MEKAAAAIGVIRGCSKFVLSESQQPNMPRFALMKDAKYYRKVLLFWLKRPPVCRAVQET